MRRAVGVVARPVRLDLPHGLVPPAPGGRSHPRLPGQATDASLVTAESADWAVIARDTPEQEQRCRRAPRHPTSIELHADGILLEVLTAGAAVRRLEVPVTTGGRSASCSATPTLAPTSPTAATSARRSAASATASPARASTSTARPTCSRPTRGRPPCTAASTASTTGRGRSSIATRRECGSPCTVRTATRASRARSTSPSRMPSGPGSCASTTPRPPTVTPSSTSPTTATSTSTARAAGRSTTTS